MILISLLVILTTVVSIEKDSSELQMNAMDYNEQVVLQINAEIVRLTDWETMRTNLYAKMVIRYVMKCRDENLPKKICWDLNGRGSVTARGFYIPLVISTDQDESKNDSERT